jgi:zinc protease
MRIGKLFVALFAAAAASLGAAPRAPSDVPADPAIVSGVLPNGLHYEILRNTTPPHTAALRLRIDVGSIEEKEDERGVAHFIEHMAMAGTRNVPAGEMEKRLERAGLRFGPDTNAFTDFRQTYYVLNLPETDTATLDTALTLLREVAGEATFVPQTVERQRGVILAEERSRATAAQRSSQEELRFLLRGDRLPERLAIGLPDTIRTVGRDRLVRFYDAYYRPERATLIAVGDFEPGKMAADIRRLFGTWRGRGLSGANPPPPVLPPRGAEAHVFADPALPPQVTLAWLGPADVRPDGRALRAERVIDGLALAVLNRRIGRISAAASLVSASVGHTTLARRADAVFISGIAKPGQWKGAMIRLAQEQQAAMARPVARAELDREIAGERTALAAAAAGAATRDSATLAQQLLTAAADGRIVSTPAEGLAEFEETVRTLTPEQVTVALRRQFARSGPLIYVTAPSAIDGGDAAVLEAWKAVKPPVEITAMGSDSALPLWPYTSFGAPGQVAERRTIEPVDATAIRFANGVRLTLKKTDFARDEVQVAVRIGGGRLQLTPDQVAPAFALSTGAFTQGGLGKATFEAVREMFATRVYSLGFSVENDDFTLSGRTRPVDLAAQLQLLAAYVTDPALRSGGWTRLHATAGVLHDQLAASPEGVFRREGQRLLHGGDPRWGYPFRAALEATGPMDARGIVAAMRLAPIEVTIVGDIDTEAAEKAVAATFGALPTRADGRRTEPTPVAFPPPGRTRLTHKGRADQGLAVIAWPTLDFYADPRRARALNLLAQVFRLRLLDEVREKLGLSYSPAAAHSASEDLRGFGYFIASIEAPPEKLDALFAAAAHIAADLRDRPVAADELERARRPTIETIRRERNGNAYWLARLADAQARPEIVAQIARAIPDYEAVTPAELQQAARTYLAEDRAWRLEIVPEAMR